MIRTMDILECKILLLIIVANGAPVLGDFLFKQRGAWPVDGGLLLPDGHRLLGPSKTWRGVLLAVTVTALTAWPLGFSPMMGLTIGAWAMLGDALSSFSKRRLGLAASSMALGLDQIPEALLPVLAVRTESGLDWLSVLKLVVGFFMAELLLSRILYYWHIRSRPY